MSTPRCVVLGAGGHATVVLDAALESGLSVVGALDADPARWGTKLLGVEVLGGDMLLADLIAAGRIDGFVLGIGCTRPSGLRRRLFEHAVSLGAVPLTVIHPNACVSRWASLGAGSVALATSVVNAGARIGVNAIINTGTIVEHDCRIGDHVHIATGAKLAGGVEIGDGAMVGAGAVVREGLSIGGGAMVGAGAAVVRAVAEGSVVVGVPAQIL